MNGFRTVGITLLTVILASCDTSILDYPDPNSKTIDNYFKTPDEIEEGAIGIYSSFFYNNTFVWQTPEMFDGLANEFDGRPASTSEFDIQALLRYQHNNVTGPITSYWRLLYRMILRSNLLLSKSQEYIEKHGTHETVTASMGDAYFLRGWAYSELAFHWGSVPLRVEYESQGHGNSPRVPVQEVWGQAERDLRLAQQLLPETWSEEFLGRATKGSATGFLGKLLLYCKRYVEAEAELKTMEGKYGLLPGEDWDNNFGEDHENNQESVFEIQCSNIPGTNPLITVYIDPESPGNPGRQNGRPQLYSWPDFANWAFQPRRVLDFTYADESGNQYDDPRAVLTFYGGIGDQTWCDHCRDGAVTFDFATYGYWYRKGTNKEKKRSEDGLKSGNNIRLLRYADVLLMRGECAIMQGNVSEGIHFINQVRTRIGAFEYESSYSQQEAFELLKRERQLELMGEQTRYNDLKRWGILKETMNIETEAMFGTRNVLDKHYLFPIPQLEIDTNRDFGPVSDSWN